MSEDHDALQREAERAGLIHLSETHRAQLAKARASAEQLIRDIPRHLHMYDEPAHICPLYTSPSPRDGLLSRMPSSA